VKAEEKKVSFEMGRKRGGEERMILTA